MRTTFPFVVIAIALCTGVLLSDSNPPSVFILIAVLLLAGPLYSLAQGKISFLHLIIFVLFMAIGYGMAYTQGRTMNKAHIDYRRSELPKTFVLNHAYGGRNFKRFKASHIESGCQTFIYVEPEISTNLFLGDTLQLKDISPISSPSNPKEFNFKEWGYRQGVHFQSWIKDDQGFQHHPSKQVYLKRLLHQCERKIANQLDQIYGSNKISHGLLYGVLLGEKSKVQEDTEALFSSSGTLHTMAVSGLHVGIIAMFLTWIMGPWQIPWFRYMKTLVILLGVWLFVFITGGKPSAIRAGTMFSLFYLGYQFQKRPSSLNILGFSVSLFIASNPWIIYDIGFQFSVTAVTSILLFYTPHLRQFQSFRIPKRLSQALALNFSVQVLVAPLSIYYFHQFPTYFFITNLIAIPLATGIVILGVGALIISLASLDLGIIICQVIQAMENLGAHLLESIMSWPKSLFSDLWIGSLSLIGLLTAGLICGIGLEAKENRVVRHGALVLILSLFSLVLNSYYKASPALVAYTGKNRGMVEIYTADTLFIWGNKNDQPAPAFRSFKRSQKQHIKLLSEEDLPLSVSTPDFNALLSLKDTGPSNSTQLEITNHRHSLENTIYNLNDINSAICLAYKSPFE